MKKIINSPSSVVSDMLEGFMAAYGKNYERVPGVNGFVVKGGKDKVSLLIGGGSGHEPLFMGFAGKGMADAVAMGNVFASPDPRTILEVTKAADRGKGVLYVYGNYAGDNMNFDMASELAEMEGIRTKTVRVWDDVASAPLDRITDRRGIAGDMFVVKIAGAAVENGYDLEEAYRVTAKARDYTRTVGIALAPGSIPGGKPNFQLAEDEIEFGMGLHGEMGVKRTRLLGADEIVDTMLGYIIEDLPYKKNDEVCVIVNGLGSTTIMELCIMGRRVAQVLNREGISMFDMDIHTYCTTQEMAGASISLMKLDDGLKKLFCEPAFAPYYARR